MARPFAISSSVKTRETEFDDYLLGRMSVAAREKLEQRIFLDDEFYEKVLAGEDDLILRYLKGGLSRSDTRRFEREYLASAARRARVDFLRDVCFVNGCSCDRAATPASSAWWRISTWEWWPSFALQATLAGFVLLAVVLSTWLASDVKRLRADLEHERRNAEALTYEVAQLKSERRNAEQSKPPATQELSSASKAVTVASFILLPGVTRGSSGTSLQAPATVETLRFDLASSADVSRLACRATIRTVGGTQVWGDKVKSPHAVVVPAVLLPPGDYVLTLQAAENAGAYETVDEYSFRITRR